MLLPRYYGRHARLLLVEEVLRDDPNNGFKGHYFSIQSFYNPWCIIINLKLQFVTVNIFHTLYYNYFFATGL